MLINLNKVVLLLIVFLLLSCEGKKQDERENLKIEDYLFQVFDDYPNFEKNGVARDDLNDFVKDDLPKKINEHLFSDIPFYLEKVDECNDSYVLNFDFRLNKFYQNNDYYEPNLLRNIEFDLYAKIKGKEKALSLIEGEYYYLDVEFKNYINLSTKNKLCVYVLFSSFNIDSKSDIEFGAIEVDIKEIKSIKE